jgi:hypothetical protein
MLCEFSSWQLLLSNAIAGSNKASFLQHSSITDVSLHPSVALQVVVQELQPLALQCSTVWRLA